MCILDVNLEEDLDSFTNVHITIVIGKNTFLKGKNKSPSLQGKENAFSKVEKMSTFLEENLTKGRS
jgi:hypothetical protein